MKSNVMKTLCTKPPMLSRYPESEKKANKAGKYLPSKQIVICKRSPIKEPALSF